MGHFYGTEKISLFLLNHIGQHLFLPKGTKAVKTERNVSISLICAIKSYM